MPRQVRLTVVLSQHQILPIKRLTMHQKRPAPLLIVLPVAHHTVDKMADSANYAADAVVHKGEQLNSLQHKLTNGTRSQVREHPLLALGIAMAGGALLGLWLSKKSDAK